MRKLRSRYEYQRGVVGSTTNLVLLYVLCVATVFVPGLSTGKKAGVIAIGLAWSVVAWAILIYSRRMLRRIDAADESRSSGQASTVN